MQRLRASDGWGPYLLESVISSIQLEIRVLEQFLVFRIQESTWH
jgi:hypothetical protein